MRPTAEIQELPTNEFAAGDTRGIWSSRQVLELPTKTKMIFELTNDYLRLIRRLEAAP